MNRLSSPGIQNEHFYDAHGAMYPHISTTVVDGRSVVKKTDTLHQLGDPGLAWRLREEQIEFF